MVIQLTENKKENHLNKITISLETFSSKYKNVLLMGDFNSERIEEIMSNFMELYDLKKNLVHVPTCYKNPENPSCIDLYLTNKNLCFQNTNAFETGLSDLRKLVVTVMKTYLKTVMHSDQLC